MTHPHRPDQPSTRNRRWIGWAGAGVAAAVLITVVAATTRPDRTPPRPGPASPTTAQNAASPTPSQPVAVPLVPAAVLARLPEATTDTTVPAAPIDPDRGAPTDGTVVHNRRVAVVFDRPGGGAVARLPVQQASNPTWLPVIARQPGWVQVLLPSRPNGASGWLGTGGLDQARSPFEIAVSVGGTRLRLVRGHAVVGQWTVAVGAPATPTPIGRTFLLAAVVDDTQSFSPLILPLGTHSTTLASYHGGPASTAIHTWPTSDVYGHRVSNGCIRVPGDALRALAQIPLGTVVRIQP